MEGSERINRSRVLPPSQYYEQEFKKDLIVLHYTAGPTADGAINWWRQSPSRVATSYVVDIDGAVYEVFPPEFWANHIGGRMRKRDETSIGIEVANWGWLEPAGTRLKTYTGRDYCGFGEKDKYVKTRAYRNRQFWAPFPEAQVDSVSWLVRHLCERFGIPHEIDQRVKDGECDLNFFQKYRGIATHTNFRTDKWDIGPAFPWEKVER